MPVKVKEIKDNALIDIKVNKNFYLMSKDALYTITLLLSEIEKQVQENPNLYDEKEVLEPDDPGYVEPKQG